MMIKAADGSRHQNHFMHFSGLSILAFIFLVTVPVLAQEHRASRIETVAQIAAIMAGDHRPVEQRARDHYRHPLETLSFFGIEPDMTVVEIWPGGQGGWYRKIIEPLLAGQGRYIPVTNADDFPRPMEKIADGSADMVLVFRAHGFMIYEKPVQKYFDALYRMLKPGGVFGIVDHAGDETIPQDPEGRNGYVNESHVRALAKQAGFVFVASSDINRNPKDTKDHPRGVWSLPPTFSGARGSPEAVKKYTAIGESDRFTLKFHKPE